MCDGESSYAYDFDIYEDISNRFFESIVERIHFTIEKNFLSQKGAMKNPTPEQSALSKEIGGGGSALWNLTDGLRDNHKLFFDRFFNSIALLEKLENRNIMWDNQV